MAGGGHGFAVGRESDPIDGSFVTVESEALRALIRHRGKADRK
jgi:hypothetical protein